MSDLDELHLFRKVITKKTVCVFVRFPISRTVRTGKPDLQVREAFEVKVVGDLGTIIHCQSATQLPRDLSEQIMCSFRQRASSKLFELPRKKEATAAVYIGCHVATATMAVNRVTFPIAASTAIVHSARPILDATTLRKHLTHVLSTVTIAFSTTKETHVDETVSNGDGAGCQYQSWARICCNGFAKLDVPEKQSCIPQCNFICGWGIGEGSPEPLCDADRRFILRDSDSIIPHRR